MAEKQLVTFFNRYSQKMETEAIYGESYLKFIYGNPLGKLALWAAVKRSFFSKWYGSRMSAQSSAKKISPFISDYNLDASQFVDSLENFESFHGSRKEQG